MSRPRPRPRLVRLALVLVAFAVAGSCVTAPVTRRRQFILVPDSQMRTLGAEAYQDVLSNGKRSDDRELTAIVERVGKRIAKASGVKYKWRFALLDAPDTVNAFCLPGGKIAVYTGILPVARTEAGLAAIVGHEVAHATLHHGAERLSQGLAAQAGLTAAGLAFSQHRALVLGALGLGAQLGVLLPYSRLHESEADKVGLVYMAKAGYDPGEAVGLWRRMARLGGERPPEFLSTHPDPARRARELKAEIPDVMKYYRAADKHESSPLPIGKKLEKKASPEPAKDGEPGEPTERRRMQRLR